MHKGGNMKIIVLLIALLILYYIYRRILHIIRIDVFYRSRERMSIVLNLLGFAAVSFCFGLLFYYYFMEGANYTQPIKEVLLGK